MFIEIKNTNYSCRKKDISIRLAVVGTLYLAFIALVNEQMNFFHSFFLITLGFLIYQLLSLVDRETLKVAKNFGVEKTVVQSFGRSSSVFVPYDNIHKIVITEVIYFVSINETYQGISSRVTTHSSLEPHHICSAASEIQRRPIDRRAFRCQYKSFIEYKKLNVTFRFRDSFLQQVA